MRSIDEEKANPSGKSILVLGATGLIGNAIVRELIHRGHKVTGTCRRRTGVNPNLDGLNLQIVYGDIDINHQLDTWIEGHDVVVDAAAPYPLNLLYSGPGNEKLTSVSAERRTDMLICGCKKHAAKLIHISTLLTQPSKSAPGPVNLQRQLMRIVHPYFLIKSAIEQRLAQAADSMPGVVIVRPSACLGPFDAKPRDQCLVPKIVCGELSMIFSQDLNVIDTRDLALGIAAIVENAHYGVTIQLTGNNTSSNEMLAEIEAVTGTAAPRWRCPAAFGVLPSYWAEILWGAAGRPSPLPSLLPILICEQGWLKTSDEQQALGVLPRPLIETIRDTVDWYHELGYC